LIGYMVIGAFIFFFAKERARAVQAEQALQKQHRQREANERAQRNRGSSNALKIASSPQLQSVPQTTSQPAVVMDDRKLADKPRESDLPLVPTGQFFNCEKDGHLYRHEKMKRGELDVVKITPISRNGEPIGKSLFE
jgi:hypothetical protein